MDSWIKELVRHKPGNWISVGVLAGVVLLVLVFTTPHQSDKPASSSRPFDPLNHSDTAQVTFKDHTLSSGLIFNHLQGDKHLTGLNETLGSGGCAFDYDNDGWIDLLLINGTGQTRYYGSRYWWHLPKGHTLFRNLGNGRFVNTSKSSGIAQSSWGMGCVSGDLDNDGDADVLITNFGANLLYRNNGNGTFTDISKTSGLTGSNWSASASLGDYDGDGLLDIYIVNYIDFRKGAHTYEEGSQFDSELLPAFNAALYSGQGNRLYRNQGKLSFKDVTQSAGVENSSGRGLSAGWLDINQDSRLDLLVLNDHGFPNALFINNGKGQFDEQGYAYRLNSSLGSHGHAIGEINGDDWLDIITTTNSKLPPVVSIAREENGKLFYKDEARPLAIGSERDTAFYGWGVGLHDFNNDQALDLLLVNGMPIPDPDTHKTSQGQTQQFWLNAKNGTFIPAHKSSIPLRDTLSSRAAISADFDNDGDIDVFVTNNNDLGQYLLNTTPANKNWIGFRLLDRFGNSRPVGARVKLYTKTSTQVRSVQSGGFLSDMDGRLHFGIGPNTSIEKIEVIWPNGDRDTVQQLTVNRYNQIVQGNSRATIIDTAVKLEKTANSNIFKKLTKASQRSTLLRWLVETRGITKSTDYFESALADDNPEVRQKAIQLIGKQRFPQGLMLAVAVLEDTDPKNRIEAIHAMELYEDEASVRWLLRMFNDPTPEVRTATAETFARFFREEEAVIYRKYLALPYLIDLLKDSESSVRIAAVRALANAERYRAVAPLLIVLNEDKEPTVRAEAARALGMIREKKAVASLLTVAMDKNRVPAVRAHALIALKRLSQQNAYQLINKILGNKKHPLPVKHLINALATITTILDNTEDGIVFDKSRLTNMARSRLLLTVKSQVRLLNDTNFSASVLKFVEAAKLEKTAELSRFFLPSTHPGIRAQAYRTIILKSKKPYTIIYQALSDRDAQVRTTVLDAIAKKKLFIPEKFVYKLFLNKATRTKALIAFKNHPRSQSSKTLFRLALDNTQETAARVATLNALSNIQPASRKLPKKLFSHRSPDLRLAALSYWAASLPQFLPAKKLPPYLAAGLIDKSETVQFRAQEILLTRREAWAIKEIQNLSLRQTTPHQIRVYIVRNLSDYPSHINHLLKLARLSHDPIHLVAMNRLSDLSSPMSDNYMKRILEEKSISIEKRFIAARSLYPRYPDVAINSVLNLKGPSQ